LPVRNGLVFFATDARLENVPVGSEQDRNTQQIVDAFAHVAAMKESDPTGNFSSWVKHTNFGDALQSAANMFLPGNITGRNVIFVTDGEPSAGPVVPADDRIREKNFGWAKDSATALRDTLGGNAALLPVEIQRSNYNPAATALLEDIAGPPGPLTRNPGMYTLATKMDDLRAVMNSLTQSLCAFGPLSPGPSAPPDAYRIRTLGLPGYADLAGDPQRVFVFIRFEDGSERRLALLASEKDRGDNMLKSLQNVNGGQGVGGFVYAYNGQTQGGFVILTLLACNILGDSPANRLVVRWDTPQLSPLPYPPPR
jgi:hypothetical protein